MKSLEGINSENQNYVLRDLACSFATLISIEQPQHLIKGHVKGQIHKESIERIPNLALVHNPLRHVVRCW